MDEQLENALREAIAFLNAQGYRYAVVGGIANQIWGEARFTYDVDLKVQVPAMDYPTVRAAIRSAFPEPARPHAPPNPLIVAVKIGQVIVDFLLALPGYEEQIITRAVRCDLGRLQVWICAPEDLIIQKAIAGRAKDWQDIEGILIEQRGRLDLAYLEDWLTQFAELLDQPEILTQYRVLQARIAAVSRGNNHQEETDETANL
ncbi:MAG: nucleotidyltransferase [Anaerolineae bacterium]|nr:nucleotidyltransferase [Anaerolineae bacterium]